jgi:hypothetical protein
MTEYYFIYEKKKHSRIVQLERRQQRNWNEFIDKNKNNKKSAKN